MQSRTIETKWAPVAILGLSGFASWFPYPAAWPFVLAIAVLLAVLLLRRAATERFELLSRPMSIALTGAIASKFVLPLLVIFAGASGLLAGSDTWIEVAMLNSVALAVVSLL